MQVVDDHVEVTETEASSGVKGQGVRYVLAISLIAVIIVLSAIWMLCVPMPGVGRVTIRMVMAPSLCST